MRKLLLILSRRGTSLITVSSNTRMTAFLSNPKAIQALMQGDKRVCSILQVSEVHDFFL